MPMLTRRKTASRWLVLSMPAMALLTLAAMGLGPSVIAQTTSGPQAQGPAVPEPQWKTSPFHGVIGGNGNVIPCRCLFRGNAYKLGDKVCMNTHMGTVMAECDLQQNNTSWVPTAEVCTTS